MGVCERCHKESPSLSYHSEKLICISCSGELSLKANSRRIRFLALKRDNFKCKICGEKSVEVRKIKGNDEILDNLISLCNNGILEKENTPN